MLAPRKNVVAMTDRVRYVAQQLVDRFGLDGWLRGLFARFPLLKPMLVRSNDDLARRILQRSRAILRNPLPVSTQRVLILTGRATDPKFAVNDGILAWALRLRGANLTLVVCDAALKACEVATINQYASETEFLQAQRPVTCDQCYLPAWKYLQALELAPRRLSEFSVASAFAEAESIAYSLPKEELACYQVDGISVGEEVAASTYRTLLIGTLDLENPLHEATLRRMLLNGILVLHAAQRMIDDLRPDCIIAHHGLYLTSGIVCRYAKRQGIRVVNWTIPYRRNTVLLSHGDTYHRTIATEPTELWQNLTLSAEKGAKLNDYLLSHWKSGWDLISYNRDAREDPQDIIRELQLDVDNPILGLFTNLQWDARIFYDGVVFDGHDRWLLETIKHMAMRPDIQLVVRVHPAEVKHGYGPVRERADEMIRQRFPTLPPHIKIIPPESDLSSYALADLISAAAVFGTKMGLEMATRGIPVIVGGEAWYRNKGFTLDPCCKEDYFALLDQAGKLPRLSPAQVEQAKRYAYHFYFRRMMDFPTLVYAPGARVLRSLEDLLPGQNPQLDVICRGILEGGHFVAPDDVAS